MDEVFFTEMEEVSSVLLCENAYPRQADAKISTATLMALH